MQTNQALTPDQLFFYENAGWSHDPKTETSEQGRVRCAIQLAHAESIYLDAHKVSTVECEWHDEANEEDEPAETCEYCMITAHNERTGKRDCLASLSQILDATDEYRRVVRAELAYECADALHNLFNGASA